MSNFKCLENKLQKHSSSTKETLSDEVSGVNSKNVVPRSTGNTNSGTRELTLKCKL